MWIDLTCKLEDRHVLKSWWSLFALFRQFETLKKATSVREKTKKISPGHRQSMIWSETSLQSRHLLWSERKHKRWEWMRFTTTDVQFPRCSSHSLHSDGCWSNSFAAPPGERWWSSCSGAKFGSSPAQSDSRAWGRGGRWMTESSSLCLTWERLINICPC